MRSALVCFEVRRYARPESISKRAPSSASARAQDPRAKADGVNSLADGPFQGTSFFGPTPVTTLSIVISVRGDPRFWSR